MRALCEIPFVVFALFGFFAGVEAASINIPPTFFISTTAITDKNEDSGMVTISNFATGITIGELIPDLLLLYPNLEQTFEFELRIVEQKPPMPVNIFKVPPRMNPSSGKCSTTCPGGIGTCVPIICDPILMMSDLEYEPNPQVSAEVDMEIILKDSGGTIPPGSDELRRSFKIFINSENDGTPTFELTPGGHPVIEVYEDSFNTIKFFVKEFTVGPEHFEYFAGDTLDYQLFPHPSDKYQVDLFQGTATPSLCTAPCSPAPTAIAPNGHTGIDVSFPDGTLSFRTVPDLVDSTTVTMSCVDQCSLGQPLRPAISGTRDWACWDPATFSSCPEQTFRVNIIAVNDPPGKCPDITTITVNECENPPAGGMLGGCAHSSDLYPNTMNKGQIMSPGGGRDEANQIVTVDISVVEKNLYTQLPTLNEATGVLSFTLSSFAKSFDMEDTITITFGDSGGTNNRWCSGQVGPACPQGSDEKVCSVKLIINSVNQPPLWTPGANPEASEDVLLERVAGFATDISPGDDPNEKDQPLSFTCQDVTTPASNRIFTKNPTIDNPSGDLEFTPDTDKHGVADISCGLFDGIDTTTYTFQITIHPVNDCPDFTTTVSKARCIQGSSYSANIGTPVAGPFNEVAQKLNFDIFIDPSVDVNAMFSDVPKIDSTGLLTFGCQSTFLGETTVRVTLKDDGDSVPPHCNKGQPVAITLVCDVHDTKPTFDIKERIEVWMSESSVVEKTRFVTNIDKGGLKDAWQTLSFEFSIDGAVEVDPVTTAPIASNFAEKLNGGSPVDWTTVSFQSLFAPAEPFTIDGDLGNAKFQVKSGNVLYGDLRIKVLARDTGAAPYDVSEPMYFVFSLLPEARPSFAKISEIVVNEDSGATRVIWAHDISAGGALPYTLSLNSSCQSQSLVTDLQFEDDADSKLGFISFETVPNAFGSVICEGCIETDQIFCDTLVITIRPINDAPTFSFQTQNVTLDEDAGGEYDYVSTSAAFVRSKGTESNQFVLKSFIKEASVGDAFEEQLQTLLWQVEVRNETTPVMFGVPKVSKNEAGAGYDLTFDTVPDAHGPATLLVTAADFSTTTQPESTTHMFHLTIASVNDAPSFVSGSTVFVLSESSTTEYTDSSGATKQKVMYVQKWATNITAGAYNEESSQLLNFVLTPKNAVPDVLVAPVQLKPDGTLVVEVLPGAEGVLQYDVSLRDDGTPEGVYTSTEVMEVRVQKKLGVDSNLWTVTPPAEIVVVEDAKNVKKSFGILKTAGTPLALNILLGKENFVTTPTFTFDSVNVFISFETKPNFYGEIKFEVYEEMVNTTDVRINGHTVLLKVTAVNDAPSFVIPETMKVLHFGANDVVETVPRFAPMEHITPGPLEENDQTFFFTVTTSDNATILNTFALSNFGQLDLSLPLKSTADLSAYPYTLILNIVLSDSLAMTTEKIAYLSILEATPLPLTTNFSVPEYQAQIDAILIAAYNKLYGATVGGSDVTVLPFNMTEEVKREVEREARAGSGVLLDQILEAFRSNTTGAASVDEAGVAIRSAVLSFFPPRVDVEWTLPTEAAAVLFASSLKNTAHSARYVNTTLPQDTSTRTEFPSDSSSGLGTVGTALLVGGLVLLVAIIAAAAWCLYGLRKKSKETEKQVELEDSQPSEES